MPAYCIRRHGKQPIATYLLTMPKIIDVPVFSLLTSIIEDYEKTGGQLLIFRSVEEATQYITDNPVRCTGNLAVCEIDHTSDGVIFVQRLELTL